MCRQALVFPISKRLLLGGGPSLTVLIPPRTFSNDAVHPCADSPAVDLWFASRPFFSRDRCWRLKKTGTLAPKWLFIREATSILSSPTACFRHALNTGLASLAAILQKESLACPAILLQTEIPRPIQRFASRRYVITRSPSCLGSGTAAQLYRSLWVYFRSHTARTTVSLGSSSLGLARCPVLGSLSL